MLNKMTISLSVIVTELFCLDFGMLFKFSGDAQFIIIQRKRSNHKNATVSFDFNSFKKVYFN